MTSPTPSPVVIDLGSNPLLAIVVGAADALLTPTGFGWVIGAIVTARWLLRDGRWRRVWARAVTLASRGRTLATLDPTLQRIKTDVGIISAGLQVHLHESEAIKAGIGAQIHEVNQRLDDLFHLGRGIQHEVLNNGGSSLKDSTHRIERALGLPEPSTAASTGPIPITPPAREGAHA